MNLRIAGRIYVYPDTGFFLIETEFTYDKIHLFKMHAIQ